VRLRSRNKALGGDQLSLPIFIATGSYAWYGRIYWPRDCVEIKRNLRRIIVDKCARPVCWGGIKNRKGKIMTNQSIFLPDYVPNFPMEPEIEIPKDILIGFLADSFGPSCRRQIIVSGNGTGKTNLLSQFCKRFSDSSISYFVDANPLTQDPRVFLHVVLNQIVLVIGKPPLPGDLSEDELIKLLPNLSIELGNYCRRNKTQVYVVIDGIDNCLSSKNGSKILESIPLTYPNGPYILMSCQTGELRVLPDNLVAGTTVHDNIATSLLFNLNDTREILSGLQLAPDEIDLIHSKAGGHPQYLNIFRKVIKTSGKDWLHTELIPSDLEDLIRRQIDQFYATGPKKAVRALEYIAASPAPIPLPLMNMIVGPDSIVSHKDFAGLGFIQVKPEFSSYSVSSEVARDILANRLGPKRKEIIGHLLEIAASSNEIDDRYLDLLLKENSDYKGISALLDNPTIIQNLNESNDVVALSTRLQTAFEMAAEGEDIYEAARWSRGISTVKALLQHTVNSREISALISIREFEDAIRKIYLVPDLISRTRLLGKAYTEMNANNNVVGKDQLEELRTLVQSIKIENIDRGLVQDIAIDIFEILPDVAIDLLERRSGDSEKNSLIDLAINTKILDDDPEDAPTRQPSFSAPDLGYRKKLHSSWLNRMRYFELLEEIDAIQKARAKEFIVRQWCIQNKTDENLPDALGLWMDIVVGDSDLHISLRSTRQLSDLVKSVHSSRILGIIRRFETLLINAIRTPSEDWYSIQLGLAEALAEIDRDEAGRRIQELYEEISLTILDKDVLIFCYARLWLAVSKVKIDLVDEIKRALIRILNDLLQNSAFHWEMLKNTLGVISALDVDEAIDLARGLNTPSRRIRAIGFVIIRAILDAPTKDFSKKVESSILEFEKPQQYRFLRSLLSELWHRDIEPSKHNQDVLLRLSRRLDHDAWIAECLGFLTTFWTNDANIHRDRLVVEVIRNWEKIEDLRVKIYLGFELVEKISGICHDRSVELCREVQRLLIQPGSSLAAGRLGVSYKMSLELAIASLCKADFDADEGRLANIIELIARIPSRFVRCLLHSELSARAYTLGYYPSAERIISEFITPIIHDIHSSPMDWSELNYALPVLLKYHKASAEKLADPAPPRIQDYGWFIALVWQITLGRLNSGFDVERIKNSSTYPIISDLAIFALKKINRDELIYSSIIAITKCIEQSIIKNTLDGTQAYDLLGVLDKIVEDKLPDPEGISHIGYLVVSKARIHAARSIVYKNLSQKQRLSKINIRQGWTALAQEARTITNIADRVFALMTLAQEYARYETDGAEIFLREADNELFNIPSIIDRSDRMQRILEVWGQWGHLDAAKYLIQKQEELLCQFDGFSRDQQLERLVQAVYEFSPEVADQVAASFYSRNPDMLYNPLEICVASKQVAKSPRKIMGIAEKSDFLEIQRAIVNKAIDDLLQSQIVEDCVVPSREVLFDWVVISSQFDEETHFKILHWATECLSQQAPTNEFHLLADYLIDSACLIDDLSRWTSPSRREGIPQKLNAYLPGMEGRIEVFKEGQIRQAKSLVKKWIKEKTKDYLKIVDPYFSLSELEFLAEAPKECKVLIVTTNSKLNHNSSEALERDIRVEWEVRGKGTIPPLIVLVVPKEVEGKFHCRAIVTNGAALDIGQSLNGLGVKAGKLTKLESEDAEELEVSYVDRMLDQNSWYLENDTRPLEVFIK